MLTSQSVIYVRGQGSPACADAGSTPSTLQIDLIDYGVFQIAIVNPPVPSAKCSVVLSTWAGTAPGIAVSLDSESCFGTYTLNGAAHGLTFSFGTNYGFSLEGKDISSAVLCSTSENLISPSTPSCPLAGLSFTRPDSVSVGVLMDSPFPFGLCRVFWTSYDSVDLDIAPSVSGPCDAEFLFMTDGILYTFTPGRSLAVYLSYYPDGVTSLCSTDPVLLLSIPTNPDCHQTLTSSRLVDERIEFRLATPPPSKGRCFLLITACASLAAFSEPLPSVQFPSCGSTLTVSFSDIANAVPVGLIPGTTCDFAWKYEYGLSESCVSSSTTTLTLRERCKVTRDDSQTALGEIELVPFVPTVLTGTHECFATLVGCGKYVIPGGLTKAFDCSSTVVFTSADAGIISGDVDCNFEVTQAPVGMAASDPARTCSSPRVSFGTSQAPQWLSGMEVEIFASNPNCMRIRWPVPENGGSPVLCYQVFRESSGELFPVQTCTGRSPSKRSLIDCGFNLSVDTRYKVVSINRIGESDPIYSDLFRFEYYLPAASESLVQLPDQTLAFSTSHPPLVFVQAYHPTSPASLDSETTERIIIAQLRTVRCKRSTADPQLTMALEPSDPGYVTNPQFGVANLPEVFSTESLSAFSGDPGKYFGGFRGRLGGIPSGPYSMLLSGIGPGGLRGSYFDTAFLSGSPVFSQVDPVIDFNWGLGQPIIDRQTEAGVYAFDLVSVRWVGFLESPFGYPEDFYFSVSTINHFKLWIDEVVVMDHMADACPGVCTSPDPVLLDASPIYRGTNGVIRQFHSIRLDYYFVGGFAQNIPAGISLKWKRRSGTGIPFSLIPADNMFSGNFLNSGVFVLVDVAADPVADLTKSELILPDGPVVAGVDFEILLQGRDPLGQPITCTAGNTFDLTVVSSLPPHTALTVAAGGGKTSSPDGIFRFTVSLPTAGAYTVTGVVETTDGKSDSMSIPSDLPEITVVPNVPVSISGDIDISPNPPIAGQEIRISAILVDDFGNQVSGQAEYIGFSAAWLYDSVAIDRLGIFDDSETRAVEFGNSFQNTDGGYDSQTGKYFASITLPHAGTYTPVFMVVVAAVTTVSVPLPDWEVHAGQEVDPLKTVILTNPFPPTDIVAGTDILVRLQLRDAFKNCISVSDPTGIDSVEGVRITAFLGQTFSVTSLCEPDPSVDGVYDCSITPTLASEMILSVTINSIEIGQLPDQSNGPAAVTSGPFDILVVPTAIRADLTIWSRLLTVVPVSTTVYTSLLRFRDEYSNWFTEPLEVLPTITVRLVRPSDNQVMVTVTESELIPQSDGSVVVPIVSASPTNLGTDPTGWVPELFVGDPAVSVPLDPGIRVTFTQTLDPSIDRSYCNSIDGMEFVLGVDTITRNCAVFDSVGNYVNAGVVLMTNFTNVLNPNTVVVSRAGVFNGGTSEWDFTVSPGGITVAGEFTVSSFLGLPGGFLGEYFANQDFSGIIFIDPKTPPSTGGNNYYTRIDPVINTDGAADIEINSVVAKSIRWTGWISAPASGTFRFTVSARGTGIKVSVGGNVYLDIAVDTVATTFDVPLILNEPTLVVVSYIPGPSALISFLWSYPDPTGVPFVIHPSLVSVFFPLPPLADTITTTAVIFSADQSYAAPPVSAHNGIPISFAILSFDATGNPVTTYPNCPSGSSTSAPLCLFDIQSTNLPIANVAIAFDVGGSYRVDLTFNGSGFTELTITYTNENKQLRGSPYPITVDP